MEPLRGSSPGTRWWILVQVQPVIQFHKGEVTLKELASVLTMVSLLGGTLFCNVASAATKEEKETKQAAQIKQRVAKMGVGEKAVVRVELKGKEKSIKGYVSKVGEENFSVTNFQTIEITQVAYHDVPWVENKHFPTSAKIEIIIAAILGIFTIIIYATGMGD
jgi:Fe-S cluster biogenesis protein NfuA